MAEIPNAEHMNIPSSTGEVCPEHPGRLLDMVCTTCKGMTVCMKCVGTSHMTHTCSELKGYLGCKTVSLQRLLQKANSKCSSIDFKLKRVSKIQIQNKKNIEDTIKSAKERANTLKAVIDSITDNYIDTCREIESTNFEQLEKLETIFTKQLKDLKETVNKCKCALGNDKYNEFTLIERMLRYHIAKPNEKPPVLVIPKIVSPHLSESDLKEQLDKTYGSLDKEAWTLEQSGLTDKEQSVITPQSIPKPSQPFTITVRASFDLPGQKYIRSVCPMGEDRAWVVNGGSNEASLTSIKGELLHTMTVDLEGAWITDISRNQEGDKALFCCGDGSIWQTNEKGKHEHLFRTDCYTNSLNMTEQTDVVAVCRHREQNIIKSKIKGRIVDTIEKDENGIQLFYKPVCVRVNRKNGDMLVLEANSPRHVIILGADKKVKCRYYGDISRDNGGPDDGDTDDEFQPWDACFDPTGHVVVADGRSKSLILIDTNGQMVRTLFEDDVGPTSLGVHKNGDIWVGYDYGSVKVIRFSV